MGSQPWYGSQHPSSLLMVYKMFPPGQALWDELPHLIVMPLVSVFTEEEARTQKGRTACPGSQVSTQLQLEASSVWLPRWGWPLCCPHPALLACHKIHLFPSPCMCYGSFWTCQWTLNTNKWIKHAICANNYKGIARAWGSKDSK